MSRVILFGASGLIGGLLAPLLGGHDLTVVGRRASGFAKEKVSPVDRWPAVLADLKPEVVISALGTTIRKAGSRDAFSAIDHDAVVALAAAAKAAGTKQFLTVSSVGASASSPNFYLATKGRTEEDVTALGFDRLDIFRPGLLLGDRVDDPRLTEQLGILLSPLTNALTPRRFDKYRAIAAADVAAAIAQVVGASVGGVLIHHNRDMLEPPRKLA